ncbi:hypothetical protein HZH66_008454 [Vespula vulgaris]|uniref:Uncharacterized protein n=1 Tax=Vespula vulgaris TaxID=7454 RepID=A0A834JS78_VESVU|nr:hypothetical protein HZH66_008454 [Vespula vulgaris]
MSANGIASTTTSTTLPVSGPPPLPSPSPPPQPPSTVGEPPSASALASLGEATCRLEKERRKKGEGRRVSCLHETDKDEEIVGLVLPYERARS